jgi:ATP phosphoribosyltransferase regulatory subunit
MRETRDAEALLSLFGREGFERIEPRILQPADAFVELSGEDIRRRIFVTQDADGAEWCLRPEYTIPVCRHYLAAGGREPAAFSYCGPVFRLRHGETGEFTQGGIESIGRRDATAADAEVIGLALEGLAALGIEAPAVRVGDVGLLHALLDGLDLSPLARRRAMRAVAAGRPLDAAADPEEAGLSEHAGLLAAIEGQAPQAARAFVEDVLAIAGIAPVGGRTPAEIAERFLARAGRRAGGMPERARETLGRYLRVRGDPDEAAVAIRSLAADAGLDLGQALDLFEERTGFMAARGLDVSAFRFAADFARNLDYYTGFIFEASAGEGDGTPLAGGGRYDRLLRHLGAPSPIPAVGCSFWLDRIRSAAAGTVPP